MGDWSWTVGVGLPNLTLRREGKRHSSEHRSPYQNDPHAAALVLLSLILQSLCCHVLASLFDCLANRLSERCATHVSSHHLQHQRYPRCGTDPVRVTGDDSIHGLLTAHKTDSQSSQTNSETHDNTVTGISGKGGPEPRRGDRFGRGSDAPNCVFFPHAAHTH